MLRNWGIAEKLPSVYIACDSVILLWPDFWSFHWFKTVRNHGWNITTDHVWPMIFFSLSRTCNFSAMKESTFLISRYESNKNNWLFGFDEWYIYFSQLWMNQGFEQWYDLGSGLVAARVMHRSHYHDCVPWRPPSEQCGAQSWHHLGLGSPPGHGMRPTLPALPNRLNQTKLLGHGSLQCKIWCCALKLSVYFNTNIIAEVKFFFYFKLNKLAK